MVKTAKQGVGKFLASKVVAVPCLPIPMFVVWFCLESPNMLNRRTVLATGAIAAVPLTTLAQRLAQGRKMR